ncbi:CocE/NonD family hydrolase [Candidatus Poseidoniales archaeon]|nr:CocE/NonD family hydrolase [Candidatus Poseidoniales archaeon]
MTQGRTIKATLLVALLLNVLLAGCFGSPETISKDAEPSSNYPGIYERHTLEWNWTGSYSRVLEDGPHEPLSVQEATIDVDTSGTWEGGPNTAEVHLSYWLPSNTELGDQVPVIAVISPYFSYGQQGSESSPTNVVSAGRGEFIYDNFVPHGYALAQVAVFATEESTGCFDYRGDGEGQGIHAAVEWLGNQNWSNGNVAIYGKSYEGATAWEAAAQGSSHLKTIVPISGTTALGPLLYKNGSAEARSQVMHSNYGGSILDYDTDDLDNMCADVVEGFLAGPTRYGLGELDPYMDNYYDERSHIDKALGKYNGSIYWVQGLQDWNVDPHQVFGGPPGTNWYQAYIDAGYDVAGMLGQWEHNYPDQWSKHNNQESGYGGEAIQNMTRWDWGQDLFEWMEYYLKDIGEKPDLHAQIQRNDGQWRIEETWPPLDVERLTLELSDCVNDGAFVGGGAPVVGGGQTLAVDCPAMSDTEHLHIAGLATIHLSAVPTFDGGQIFVEMQDAETGIRLGHATMDVRYHAGGYEAQTVIPGEAITMLMEFQAIDAILPAGHGLRFVLSEQGEDYLAPACGTTCTVHVLPSLSIVELPLIERTEADVLLTPQSEEAANNN